MNKVLKMKKIINRNLYFYLLKFQKSEIDISIKKIYLELFSIKFFLIIFL